MYHFYILQCHPLHITLRVFASGLLWRQNLLRDFEKHGMNGFEFLFVVEHDKNVCVLMAGGDSQVLEYSV